MNPCKSNRAWRTRLGAVLLGIGLGLGSTASAVESGPLIQGSYEIEAWYMYSAGPPSGVGCMIDGNAASQTPSAYHWPGSGAFCGLEASDLQTIWDIYPVVSGEKVRHVIKSRRSGQCLIRSDSGRAPGPTLYLWAGGDAQFCGLSSADALIANGQAAWDFTKLETKVHEAGGIVYAGPVHLGQASLGFWPLFGATFQPNVQFAEFPTVAHDAASWRMNLWSTLAKPVWGKMQ